MRVFREQESLFDTYCLQSQGRNRHSSAFSDPQAATRLLRRFAKDDGLRARHADDSAPCLSARGTAAHRVGAPNSPIPLCFSPGLTKGPGAEPGVRRPFLTPRSASKLLPDWQHPDPNLSSRHSELLPNDARNVPTEQTIQARRTLHFSNSPRSSRWITRIVHLSAEEKRR